MHTPKLVVGGFVPFTTIDCPGKLSAVIFCQGCPWRCRYCHNTHLIPRKSADNITWETIITFLKRRQGILDSVVFSGGEPTMQMALKDAMQEVSDLNFSIALHTAGQFPEILKSVLPRISWVGMDIKAPPSAYKKVTQRTTKISSIEQSIHYIVSSGKPYQFRTTVHPLLLRSEDIEEIKSWLRSFGVEDHTIQTFRPNGCKDSELIDHAPRI